MKVFTYWHDKTKPPPYIRLCIDIMESAFKKTEFMFLDKEDIKSVLPDMRDGIWNVSHVNNKGSSAETIRSDYIRNHLLYKYGGYWIDADTIVLKDFDLLPQNKNYVGRRNEVGSIGIGFIGAKKESKIIGKYITAQDKVIDKRMALRSASEFGSKLITEILKKIDDYIILDNRVICPINFKNRDLYFREDLDIKQFINYMTHCFQLFNRGFSDEFKSMSIEDILKKEWLITKLFKFAMERTGIEGI